MAKRTDKHIPIFEVTQEDYDNATHEERETMRVSDEILPPPDSYTPQR